MSAARILIVEDERIIAAELKRRVSQLGYTVVAAVGTGTEAIETARQLCPDLVLMDVGLSGEMNGLEAAARIWEEGKIPVVYLTAYAAGSGLTGVKTPLPLLALSKPLDSRTLKNTLVRALVTAP